MLRNIVVALLVIVVAGTGYWGYQEHQEKNAILIQAENTYQRSFHDLTYQVDLLHDKIGSTLAMNSRTSLSPTLAEVWQIASNANSDVGQLPLTLMPFNKTEEFLASIAQFSYRTAIRDLDKEPLSDKEYQTLKQLYNNSADIQNELRSVQNKVLKNNLRWMDVEMAMAAGEKKMDNTIIDGFKTVEKNAEEYANVDFGPSTQSMSANNDGKFANLHGKKLSKEEVIYKAKKFLGLKGNMAVDAVKSGKGADNAFYSLTIKTPNHDAEIYMDITETGGYPIWLMKQKDIGEQKISLNQAYEKALTYLKNNQFEQVELVESSQYDTVGVFTFASSRDGVRVYPESIQVKVGLDQGDVIGLSARDYLSAHKDDRNIAKPKITAEEARKAINPKVKVMEHRLAIIKNDIQEEVLVHEFLGTIQNDTYRIFVNAEDGREEKVEKLKQSEPMFNQA